MSAERKSHAGKESVAKEEQSGRISSKKGRKATSLLRPVSLKCSKLMNTWLQNFPVHDNGCSA